MNLAHVSIVGNLTSDPKLHPASDGKKPFCRFSVAVNERRGEDETVANYFDITAFGDLAESVASSLSKGNRVIVSGKLNSYQESYTTPDGREAHRTRIGIVATAVGPDLFHQFARPAKLASSNGGKPAAKPVSAAAAAPVVEEEDF